MNLINFLIQLRVSHVSNQKGYVLIATYLMVAVLSATSMATFMRSYTFAREAEKQKNAIVALEMAEGAIDLAITQLATNQSYAGVNFTDFSSGNAKGGYSISVTTPAGAPSTVRQIAVTGFSPSNTATEIGYKYSNISAYTQFPSTSYFSRAIFANTSYSNSGNGTTDSYDSSVAAYNASTAGSNGDVGTNSVTGATVTLSGNARVKGDVAIGAGGSTSSVITTSGNASITGTRSAQTSNTVLTTPTTSLASSGAVSVSGNNTLSLSAGTYHYSSFSITGNGRLNTTGEVTIYVSGSVSIAGNGTAAYSNLPKNLKIFVTNSSNVSVTGNGNVYAAIYAPLSRVQISGNGQVYGAVVGDTVSMSGNANFHYDESLNNIGGGSGGDPTLLSWVQTGNSSWTN